MYIRFETSLIHPDSNKPSGVIQAINYLEEFCEIEKWHLEVIDEVRDCLDELEAPEFLDSYDTIRYLAWFTPEAKKHIQACELLIPIYDLFNISVTIKRSKDIGKIVYRDKYQVIAIDKN